MLVQSIASLHRIGGRRLVRDVEHAFLESAPVLLETAEEGCRAGAMGVVLEAIRALQSTSAQLGAIRLQRLCARIEDRSSIDDPATLQPLLDGLHHELTHFRNRLKEATHRMNAVAIKPTVLLVEDNPDNRELVRTILAEDYEVIECGSGEEALQTLSGRKPDLVLMDIAMPGLDGIETLARWRSDPTLPRVPVIAVTAHAMAGDRERLLSRGFDAYISKPIVADGELLEIAAGLIRANR